MFCNRPSRLRSRVAFPWLPSWCLVSPLRSIKSAVADSVEIVIQVERRPGRRFVSEVIEIAGYDPDGDRFDFRPIYRKEEAPND